MKMLEGKKTILGILAFAAAEVANYLGYPIPPEAYALIAAWTGYGVVDKLERKL